MSRRIAPLLGILILGSLSQLGFAPPQQERFGTTTNYWWALLLVVVLLVALLWWALRYSPAQDEGEDHTVHAETAAPVESAEPAPAEPDDLQRIEGIGPKVSAALIEMGITTFAQLAKAEPAKLEADLKAAGVRIIKGAPVTWPDQAALAAKGDWAGFEALTSKLKGGRRVE